MDTSQITTFIPRVLIRSYQVLMSGAPRRCRFYPSCSQYMLDALEQHGLCKGLFFGSIRLLKCHPWHPGGVDPVHQ